MALAGCTRTERTRISEEQPTRTPDARRFDDWRDWSVMGGTASLDPEVTYDGMPTVRVVAGLNDRRGGVSFRFDEPQDFSDVFFTVALRWLMPRRESDVTLDLQLTDGAGNREVQAVPVDEGIQGDDGFVRLAFGYKYTPGDRGPDLTDIRRLDVYHFTGGDGPMAFWLADLQRVHSDRDRGVVLVHFDDRDASIYSEAFRYMRRYEMPGTFNLISRDVDTPGAVTQTQVDEMADAGWDITAHPQYGRVLGDLSASELSEAFADEQAYLRDHGFEPRILTWPHNSYDGAALSTASDHFDLAFAGGMGLTAPRPVAPYTMPRLSGDDPAVAKRVVDRAAAQRGLGMLTYHVIGDAAGCTSVDAFREAIDYLAAADVDVVASSALLDGTS